MTYQQLQTYYPKIAKQLSYIYTNLKDFKMELHDNLGFEHISIESDNIFDIFRIEKNDDIKLVA
jgi:hypothetical protein